MPSFYDQHLLLLLPKTIFFVKAANAFSEDKPEILLFVNLFTKQSLVVTTQTRKSLENIDFHIPAEEAI